MKFVDPAPWLRSIRYPATPTLSVDDVQLNSISAMPAALAIRLVGIVGALASGFKFPPSQLSMVRGSVSREYMQSPGLPVVFASAGSVHNHMSTGLPFRYIVTSGSTDPEISNFKTSFVCQVSVLPATS